MSPSDMDMDLILTLDALLRDQNITHAAARLGISQPAMSARLARLRVLFGEPLFVPSPHGRGVLPTPRAEALRPQVATVLQGISAMLEPTTFNAQNSNRTFVIALHENPALMLGAELQNQISSAAPGIRLRFALPETQLLPAQMENGDVDIYVGVNAVAHDAWVRRKLFDDEYATAQQKAIRAVRVRWIWIAIVAFPTWWFHPRATRSRALSISIWRGLATSVT
ncbi:HTH-type transcriptional activator nahR [Enterobacter hormaechei]|nr:LysR family transcriptional regulator [Enterobacter hormaechei]VAF65663.1 HTH-type transcriptional activator nahR [Enterobacter hormaechei]